MENGENKNLQGRRDFFKEAAKKALPILGAVALMSNPMIAKAVESEPLGCNSACSYGCTGTCYGDCYGTCKGGCSTECRGTCKGTCYTECLGTCSGKCSSTCKGMQRNAY